MTLDTSSGLEDQVHSIFQSGLLLNVKVKLTLDFVNC